MHSFAVGLALSTGLIVLFGCSLSVFTVFVAVCLLCAAQLRLRCVRLFIIGWLIAGLVATVVQRRQFDRQISSELIGANLLVQGQIIGIPQSDGRRTRFEINLHPQHASHAALKGKLRLSWYGFDRPELQPGDTWQLTVRLKPPSGLGNAGGFDYSRWLFQQQVVAVGYVRDSPAPLLIKQASWNTYLLRGEIAQRIYALPSANEFAAVVAGLSVGVKAALADEHWTLLRESGTAHLLAISGLHIGLVSGWAYLLGGGLWRLLSISTQLKRRPTRFFFSIMASVIAASAYAMLAGFSLPTQRALMMLIAASLVMLCRRFWPPWTAYTLALSLVLLFSPLSMLSAGFWLSFTTVAALIYLHAGRLSERHWLLSSLRVHLMLGVVLLPSSAWFFQSGALIAPLANAIAIPVIGLVVVPLSLAIIVLLFISDALADLALTAAQWLIEKVFTMLHWLIQLEWAHVLLIVPSAEILIYTVLGLALLLAPRGTKMRWLAVPLLAPVMMFNVFGPKSVELELHVLDVGQGHAALIFTRNSTVLFDTGNRFSSDSTMAERVVVPFLHSHGRKSIDVLVVSHADADHAAGADWLIQRYPKMRVYASDQKNLNNALLNQQKAHFCLAGDSWYLDEVGFSFLHPAKGDFGDTNNLSCVLLVHAGQSRVLLTGDIERRTEGLITARLNEHKLKINVMVAPHHGSRSSSTMPFLNKFNPEHVVFPAGFQNKFGFPHKDVVDRYQSLGSRTFTTGEQGAISFHFNRKGLIGEPEYHWQRHRRFW